MKKFFLAMLSLLALCTGFIGCSDSADNNDDKVTLKDFSEGWWLYDDSYSKVYIYYDSDKGVKRAGTEGGEYEGASLSQAQKLYVFTDEKINKNLSKITDEAKYPTWESGEAGSKISFELCNENLYGKTEDYYFANLNGVRGFFELKVKDKDDVIQDVIDNAVVKAWVCKGRKRVSTYDFITGKWVNAEDFTGRLKKCKYNTYTSDNYFEWSYDDEKGDVIVVKYTVTYPEAEKPFVLYIMTDEAKPEHAELTAEDYLSQGCY